MNATKFSSYVKKWMNEKRIKQNKKLDAEFISVEEIYRSKQLDLNRSYYQIIIEPADSKTGNVEMLLYSTIDLLTIDEEGDITDVNVIDYQIER